MVYFRIQLGKHFWHLAAMARVSEAKYRTPAALRRMYEREYSVPAAGVHDKAVILQAIRM